MNQIANHFNTIGNERDWIWRGWKIRYSFKRVSPEVQNSDIPLILLHGFGISLKHWRKNIPILSENHTVYALDLLGFGASKKAYTNYNIQLWSELVYDFWQTFIRQPVILIGNSIGSLIALNVSSNYPDTAKGLVMLSLPDVTQRQKMIPKTLQPIINTIENLVASPLLIKAIFYFVRRPNFIRRSLKLAYVNHDAITDELVEIICTPTQDKGATRTLVAITKNSNKPNYSPSPSQLLKQLDIPILLLWGKSDRLIPPILAHHFAQQNPHIKLQLLDNVGHCPHDESPERFNQILTQWINDQYYS